MGAGLAADLEALEHAALMLRQGAARLADQRVAGALADGPDALPATDTAAACIDLGRRLDAGVLAFADSLDATADALVAAALTYRDTDRALAARAAASASGAG